jgi:hypothetical protein
VSQRGGHARAKERGRLDADDGACAPLASELLGLGAEGGGAVVGDPAIPQSGKGATKLGSEGNRNGERSKDGRGKHTFKRQRVH